MICVTGSVRAIYAMHADADGAPLNAASYPQERNVGSVWLFCGVSVMWYSNKVSTLVQGPAQWIT